MSQQQIINSLLNLHQLFANLHDLKFKGRKVLEDLINTRYQESLLIKHAKNKSETLIFQNAIKHCKISQGELISLFEQTILQHYINFCEKVQLNTQYLSNFLNKKQFDPPLSPYRFLLLELIHIGLDLGEEYEKQKDLIDRFWRKTISALLKGENNEEEMKEFMLHIGFQSFIEEEKRNCWRIKMAAVGNQRYNPRK